MWRSGKGFTLIELMVVIAIILILALIAVPAYRNMQIRAKKSRAQEDMRNIATALEAYYVDWNTYPSSLTPLTGSADSTTSSNTGTSATGEVGPITYMAQLPTDPFSPGTDYNYEVDTTNYDAWVLYTATYKMSGTDYREFRDSNGNAGSTTTEDLNPPS